MLELKALAKNFVNLFYPLHCLGCNERLEALNEFSLCSRCINSIKINSMPPFELEGIPVMVYSAALYEGTLKELIHSFKYKGKLALCGILSKFMVDYIKDNPEIAVTDIVTAVPLHRSRLKEREFNQSLELAKRIAKEFGIAIENILEKVRKTRYQNELQKSDRLKNLRGAFDLRPRLNITGKSILLVDDVMTTGATLSECAQTLISGGASKVTCFTLARGI